jgi:hypothetical protein
VSVRLRGLWVVEISEDGENWRPLSSEGEPDTPVYGFRTLEEASAMAGPGCWAPGVQRRVVQFVLPKDDRR